jgi:hypothetical protein
MGMRPSDKLTLISAMLGMGGAALPQSQREPIVQRRELPPGGATEEQKQIRGPKVGKRTKKWRKKHLSK